MCLSPALVIECVTWFYLCIALIALTKPCEEQSRTIDTSIVYQPFRGDYMSHSHDQTRVWLNKDSEKVDKIGQ